MPKRTIIDTQEEIDFVKQQLRDLMNFQLENIAYCGQKFCEEEDRTDGFHKARMRKVTWSPD